MIINIWMHMLAVELATKDHSSSIFAGNCRFSTQMLIRCNIPGAGHAASNHLHQRVRWNGRMWKEPSRSKRKARLFLWWDAWVSAGGGKEREEFCPTCTVKEDAGTVEGLWVGWISWEINIGSRLVLYSSCATVAKIDQHKDLISYINFSQPFHYPWYHKLSTCHLPYDHVLVHQQCQPVRTPYKHPLHSTINNITTSAPVICHMTMYLYWNHHPDSTPST